MKNGHWNARSSSSSRVARITAGKANTIMPANTSMDQANTGILSRVMPGARVRKNADDDLDRPGDRRNLDEADAEQPEIGVVCRANTGCR